MIKIFIVLILAYSINSNFESCLDEINSTNCQIHDNDIINGYCSTIINPGIPDDDGEIKDQCVVMPESAENQKVFWKLYNGIFKEGYLLNLINGEEYLVEPKKDHYKKGEIVEVNKRLFTEEEKAKVNKNNTCLYHNVGKMNEFLEAIGEAPENWTSIPLPNITDKNDCFGADKFNDLKNLLNCGYANIKIFTKKKTLTYKTCHYIPDKQMSNDFLPIYKHYFVDDLMFNEDLYSDIIDAMEPDMDVDFKKSFHLGHKKRKLADIEKYEITVEDKYGKIIKFDKNSDTITIVDQGHQTDSDKEEVDDDEPSKIKTSSSGYSKLNMILLLSVILMVI